MVKWLAGQTAVVTARVRPSHEWRISVECKVIALPDFYGAVTGATKMYWLVGETDSALSDEEKEPVWRRREEQRKLVVKNFSQNFVKNAFDFLWILEL